MVAGNFNFSSFWQFNYVVRNFDSVNKGKIGPGPIISRVRKSRTENRTGSETTHRSDRVRDPFRLTQPR